MREPLKGSGITQVSTPAQVVPLQTTQIFYFTLVQCIPVRGQASDIYTSNQGPRWVTSLFVVPRRMRQALAVTAGT